MGPGRLDGSKILRAALLLASAGCGPSTMTPEQAQLDAALERSGREAFPEGVRLRKVVGHAQQGELEDGFIVMLAADTCYALASASEPRIRALEVLVTSPTGAWLAKTKEPSKDPTLRLCTKISGPHRIGVKVSGRGDYVFGVYGAEPKAAGSAVAATSAAPSASDAAVSSAARLPKAPACAAVGERKPFARAIAAEHRACAFDADCITLKADCGGRVCTGVNKSFRAEYAQPLDCRGFAGELAAHDCDPQLGLEAPRCEAGCCTSAPTQGR